MEFEKNKMLINELNNSESKYNQYINGNIINDFDNENYRIKTNEFIKNILTEQES